MSFLAPVAAGGLAAGTAAGALGAGTAAAAGGAGIAGLLGGGMLGKILLGAGLLSNLIPKHKDKDSQETPYREQTYNLGSPVFPGKNYNPGVSNEWDYFPKYAGGGPVGMAPGGISNLMPPQGAPPEAAAPPQGGDDKQLIALTVAAIQGQVPNPQPIIQAFVQAFGQDALKDLVQRVKGGGQDNGPVQGPGDGLSDQVPATVDGQQPASLSNGEFVVPADVVSGIGNGSTNAGAERLKQMLHHVRTARTGTHKQPPAIDPSQVMPA